MRIAGRGIACVNPARHTPGSCLAAPFRIGAKRVVQCRDAKQSSRHRPQISWDGHRDLCTRTPTLNLPLSDIVSAGDLAEALDCDHAGQAPQVLGISAGCLADAFEEHGMKLSYGPRKPPPWCSLAALDPRVLPRPCSAGQLYVVPHYYKHVGVLQSFDGSFRLEMKHRLSEAWGTFRCARRKVFKNLKIGLEAKRGFLPSLVLAKLLYGAGSWPPLKVGEYRSFQGALLAFYSRSWYRERR